VARVDAFFVLHDRMSRQLGRIRDNAARLERELERNNRQTKMMDQLNRDATGSLAKLTDRIRRHREEVKRTREEEERWAKARIALMKRYQSLHRRAERLGGVVDTTTGEFTPRLDPSLRARAGAERARREANLAAMVGAGVGGAVGAEGFDRRGGGRGGGRGPIGAFRDILRVFRGRRGFLGGFSGFVVVAMTGLLAELSTAVEALTAAVLAAIPVLSALGAGLAAMLPILGAVGFAFAAVAAVGIPALTDIQEKYQAVQAAAEAVNTATTAQERRDALKQLQEANSKLTASEYAVIGAVKQLGRVWEQETSGMREQIIRLTADTLNAAAELLPIYGPFIREMGNVNERLGRSFISFMRDPREIQLNQRLLAPMPDLAEDTARAFGKLAIVLRGVMIAATPLAQWILRGLNSWLGRLAETASSDEGLRGWTSAFNQMRPVLRAIWNFLTSLVDVWNKVTFAAAPLATWILNELARQLDRISGMNTQDMRIGFVNQIPHLRALGRLFEGLIKSIMELAEIGDPFLDPIVDALTNSVLPAIVEVARNFTEHLGPIFPRMLAAISELAIFVSEIFAPAIGAVASAFTRILEGFNNLPDWVKKVLIAATGGAVFANRAFGVNILSKIPGIGKFFEGRPKGSASDPIFTIPMGPGGGVPGVPGGKMPGPMRKIPGGMTGPLAAFALGVWGGWELMERGRRKDLERQRNSEQRVYELLREGRDISKMSPITFGPNLNEDTLKAIRGGGIQTALTLFNQRLEFGKVTPARLKQAAIEQLKLLPESARNIAAMMMIDFAEEMERNKRAPEGSAMRLAEALMRRFEGMLNPDILTQALMGTLGAALGGAAEALDRSLPGGARRARRRRQQEERRRRGADVFQSGGIFHGPMSGSWALLHGTEAIVPLSRPTPKGAEVLLQAIRSYAQRGIKPSRGAVLTPTTHGRRGSGTEGSRSPRGTNVNIATVNIYTNDPEQFFKELEREINKMRFQLPAEDIAGMYT
jgi:hypothetical protein